jgi:tol-pal system protein YbgF
MKKIPVFLQALSLTVALPVSAHAGAPVVDNSQNFAMFEDQQVNERPVAKEDEDQHSGLSLLNKVQGLQQEIQELRGELEVQANRIKQLQAAQQSGFKDSETGANPGKFSSNQAAPPAAPLPSTIDNNPSTESELQQVQAFPQTNPADEQVSYLAAYDLVKDKRFDEALQAMQIFVQRFPHGGYTANAHYWLGELQMVKKNYSQAIIQFETVLTHFPSSSKVAACSLKIGYALAACGKAFEARLRLQQVLKNYPDSPTAQLAAAKLHSMTAT